MAYGNGLSLGLPNFFTGTDGVASDISRAYLFRINIPIISQAATDYAGTSKLTAWCQSAKLPAFKLKQEEIKFQSQTIRTITYPAYFTPNGDSYNEYWNINGLLQSYNANIYIFDRYGKLIKELKPNSGGWDGTFNGKTLPSTDYWFKVEYTENGIRKEFKSHFSLKR